MKKLFEIIFIYLIGVVFILTLALRVNEIEKDSIPNASIASSCETINNYE